MSAPKVRPWTQRHVAVASSVLWSMGADEMAKVDHLVDERRVEALQATIPTHAASEIGFVDCVAWYVGAMETARILRWVRARAEGRVEETVTRFFRVRLADGRYVSKRDDVEDPASAADAATETRWKLARDLASLHPGARVVRVKSTRRRIVKAVTP